jgi:hypothetical protein
LGAEDELEWCVDIGIVQYRHLIVNLLASECTFVGSVFDDMKADFDSDRPVRDTGSCCFIAACFAESVEKFEFFIGNFVGGEMLGTAASATVNESLLGGPSVVANDEGIFCLPFCGKSCRCGEDDLIFVLELIRKKRILSKVCLGPTIFLSSNLPESPLHHN